MVDVMNSELCTHRGVIVHLWDIFEKLINMGGESVVCWRWFYKGKSCLL